MKVIAPLYIWSGDSVELQQSVDGLRKGDIAIVNGPDSGVPTAEQSSELRSFVARLQKNGVVVVGYVRTTYGRRPTSSMQDEAVAWRVLTGVDGIFFDETSVSNSLGYFRSLHGQCRSWRAYPGVTVDGHGITVFNPGAWDSRIPDLMRRLPGSIWNVWEGTAQDYLVQKPKVHRFPEREAHIIYGAGNATVVSPANLGFRFVTTDTMQNPFDTFPEGVNRNG